MKRHTRHNMRYNKSQYTHQSMPSRISPCNILCKYLCNLSHTPPYKWYRKCLCSPCNKCLNKWYHSYPCILFCRNWSKSDYNLYNSLQNRMCLRKWSRNYQHKSEYIEYRMFPCMKFHKCTNTHSRMSLSNCVGRFRHKFYSNLHCKSLCNQRQTGNLQILIVRELW